MAEALDLHKGPKVGLAEPDVDPKAVHLLPALNPLRVAKDLLEVLFVSFRQCLLQGLTMIDCAAVVGAVKLNSARSLCLTAWASSVVHRIDL